MDLQNKYKKLDHREHVLTRPGMYIGSIEEDTQITWVFDSENQKMIKKEVKITPGLYKIYDEILVNAIDHITRLKQQKDLSQPVKNIKINIAKDTGVISVFNDGDGIEIEKHTEHDMFIPELIFGHLLTSANYDDSEEKIIGGQNGIGAKACNIFSKWFKIETVDYVRKKIYTQEFSDNMSKIGKPVIKACNKKPYTMITFLPDYQRFKLSALSDDMYSLFMKRAYDVCALTDSDVNVWINDKKLQDYKTFEKYADLYLGPKTEHPRFYERINDRWDIMVTYTDQIGFDQVSFVNGIWTMRGGKHVEYISNQICNMMAELITKKRKDVDIKPAHVKNYLMVFVKSVISTPTFDSQTKDMLTTPVSKFGSKAEINEKFIDKLYKSDLTEKAIGLCSMNESKQVKKTDGKKVSTLKGIDKLDDANWAGTAKSKECTLILTEGDSAKSMAIAGLTVVGRDRYGVFPLKGKLMNVKDMTAKKVSDNDEITNLKKILGLETGKVYTSIDDLRYGKVMIMTDADVDGSHIKGLLFNMFHTLWPSLLKINGFLTSLLTPIIKASKGTEELSFYTLTDFEKWKEQQQHSSRGWTIKYYKGLGTSKEKEAKEYFRAMKTLVYSWDNDEIDENALDLAFNKKRADDRKVWLGSYDRGNVLDYTREQVTFDKFINKDLIHFSNYDIERSIPCICDGLKVSQRKILFGCFKKNISSEIKVEQLTGYVSENTAYHHGEASLSGTIIGMAQDFVGSNNLNILKPNGQFGTRISGGKDHSSPRYIYTQLFPITRCLFKKEDEAILNYRDDDGLIVEPDYYIPIIPMVLVNGAIGIGTGFSTNVPCYNPYDIIHNLKCMLNDQQNNKKKLVPWYRCFEGGIIEINPGKYASVGKYERVNDTTVRIIELPIGYWTEDFKSHLETFVENNADVKKFESHYPTRSVNFLIMFASKDATDKYLALQENGHSLLENELKMLSTKNLTTSNMYLFNWHGQIQKYETVDDIMLEYYAMRLVYYQKRMDFMLGDLQHQIDVAQSKLRFVSDIINKNIDLTNKTKSEIEAGLYIKEYLPVDGNYEYLLRMPLYTLSQDNVAELKKHVNILEQQYQEMNDKTPKQIWLEELELLEKEYDTYMLDMEAEYKDTEHVDKKPVKKRRAPTIIKKA